MQLHRVSFHAMGSPCSIRLFAQSQAQAEMLAMPAIAEVQRLETAYSRYRPDSILSRINAAAGAGAQTLDPETSAILDYAFQAWHESDGLFDVTSGVLRRAWDFQANVLPTQMQIDALKPLLGMAKLDWRRPELRLPLPGMQLDFGGCVKEYAADSAANCLRAEGVDSGVVELGGDVVVVGPQKDGSQWRLGVRDPFARSQNPLVRIGISEGAMASSGDYERVMVVDNKRYCHILNPLTGWPVEPPASVSVIGATCLVAGTVSTIAMLKGEEGCREWLDSVDLPYCLVRQSGELVNRF